MSLLSVLLPNSIAPESDQCPLGYGHLWSRPRRIAKEISRGSSGVAKVVVLPTTTTFLDKVGRIDQVGKNSQTKGIAGFPAPNPAIQDRSELTTEPKVRGSNPLGCTEKRKVCDIFTTRDATRSLPGQA